MPRRSRGLRRGDGQCRPGRAAPRINGVLVQPMVPAGLELVVGGRLDPLFGPMVVVGLGGIFVELLRDSATALAPVQEGGARDAAPAEGLSPVGGLPRPAASGPGPAADVIRRVSELVADQRGRVAEIDLNPLICAGDRQVAVDALSAAGDGESATRTILPVTLRASSASSAGPRPPAMGCRDARTQPSLDQPRRGAADQRPVGLRLPRGEGAVGHADNAAALEQREIERDARDFLAAKPITR